ncbi:MAG: hypothetical protein WA395_16350 [Nitrososphaeraceae archaeon]
MRTKQSITAVGLVAVIFFVGASIMPAIATSVVALQSRPTNTNTSMSSVMMESVRMHLKAADKAMSGGNPGIALEQMKSAQMQLSMIGMKNMGIMNQSQAMQFIKGGTANIKAVPENCIILNDGTLECKDSLTNSYSFTTQ